MNSGPGPLCPSDRGSDRKTDREMDHKTHRKTVVCSRIGDKPTFLGPKE